MLHVFANLTIYKFLSMWRFKPILLIMGLLLLLSTNIKGNKQPILIFISLSILTLSSHLRLGLPKGLFPVGEPVKILKALLSFSILAT